MAIDSTGESATMNKSAVRAVRLLEDLAVAGPSSLGDIARRLAWSKSTAHRFAAALIETGYVWQESGTRTYRLSMKTLELASHILDGIDLRQEVRPVLEETARLTGETAHLGVLEGLEVVYIDKVEGRQAVRMASRIGLRGTCHSTALGKVLLSNQPEGEWRRYVEELGLTPRTPQTITDRDGFLAELRRVRELDYATDDVENEEGIRCVAAPIRDHSGSVVAGMSVSGWTLSMTPERVEALVPVVAQQAASASLRLGYLAAGDAD